MAQQIIFFVCVFVTANKQTQAVINSSSRNFENCGPRILGTMGVMYHCFDMIILQIFPDYRFSGS